MNENQPTPETDAAQFHIVIAGGERTVIVVNPDFARKLERERDAARAERDEAVNALNKAFTALGTVEDWLATPREDLIANAIMKLRSQLATLRFELTTLRAQSQANDVALRAALEKICTYDSEALRETMLIWIRDTARYALATESPGAPLLEAVRKAHEALQFAAREVGYAGNKQICDALAALAPFVPANPTVTQ